MRTRLIRPEFFTDELMAEASIETRLVYIGLWTLTDDAGYFESRPRQVAAVLFGFEDPAPREARVEAALAWLVDHARVRHLPCGSHAVIPTIPHHRTSGGVPLFTIRKRHETRCARASYVDTTEGYGPVSVSDSESGLSNAQARRDAAHALMRAQGGFAASLVGGATSAVDGTQGDSGTDRATGSSSARVPLHVVGVEG